MAETTNVFDAVENAAIAAEVTENAVANNAEVKGFDFNAVESTAVDRKAIQQQLLASGYAKAYNGLHIRNVNVNTTSDNPFVVVTSREQICGNKVSADFQQTIGLTNVISISMIDIMHFIKDSEFAIFDKLIADSPADILKVLLNGGTMSVIQEFVPAGTVYCNPFAANSTEHTYAVDKMITHLIDLTAGKGASLLYAARIQQLASK